MTIRGFITLAIWSLRENRRARHRTPQPVYWPPETDGINFPDWVNDRDWDLAAKLELDDWEG